MALQEVELDLKTAGEREGPLADLALHRPAPAPARPVAVSRVRPEPTTELPLFVAERRLAPDTPAPDAEADTLIEMPDDEASVIRLPPAPRPLSVRRATPDPAKMRARYGKSSSSPPPEADLLSELEQSRADAEPVRSDIPAWLSEPTQEQLPEGRRAPVGAVPRLAAAAVDAALLGALNLAVTWATLRFSGLSFSEVGILPVLPLFAFFLLINTGYVLMFTAASGQTVGKMAAGIRVVGTSPDAHLDDRVTFGQAALRALVAVPSVLVFGAGFVPALVGDGRALHDRVAHTRVVRL